MKKARLFKKLKNKKIQCLACQRYCQISEGQVGFCLTRLNKNGELYSLTYGILNGIQIDPIEKKPLYHFYPGTQVLSIGSYGCNFRCKQCLNWHCSWGEPAVRILQDLKTPACGSGRSTLRYLSECSTPDPSAGKQNSKLIKPHQIIDLTKKNNCPGVAFTYNEPSIWPEYVYDVAKKAKQNGLYTVFVTNGSWSKECLDYLAPVIDAVNIDIKGFGNKTYQKMAAFWGDLKTVTELVVKKYKIHTELTTLVIPEVNDSPKELTAIACWIAKDLSQEIPWHLSRFDPDLSADKEFSYLPDTPIATLKEAYKIGQKAGLRHVYVWAPPKKFSEELYSVGNTYCPQCNKLLVERQAWQPEIIGVKKVAGRGYCKFCGQDLYLRL